MNRSALFAPALAGLLALAPTQILAQFDPDCWLEQMRKADSLRAINPALHGEAMQRGHQIIRQGQTLSRQLVEARQQAHQAIHAQLDNDPAFRGERQRLEQRAQQLDYRSQQAVRQLRRDEERFHGRFNAQAEARAVAQPAVDGRNAAVVAFQRESNRGEAEFHKRRLEAGAPAQAQQQAFDEAVKTASRELALAPELREQARNNRALAEAAAAAAIGVAIARGGSIPDSMEALTGRAEAVGGGHAMLYDGTRKVAIDISARSLEGGMGLAQVGDRWGGRSDVVDVRASMGPQTRQAVSAIGAVSLLKLDQTVQAQRIMRGAIRKVEPPLPEVRNDPQRSQSYVQAVSQAVNQAAEEIRVVIRQGPPIIVNKSDDKGSE